jgi:hypothetical protein
MMEPLLRSTEERANALRHARELRFVSARRRARLAIARDLLLCFGKKFAEKVLQENKGCVQIRRRTWMCVPYSANDQVTKVLRIADTHHAPMRARYDVSPRKGDRFSLEGDDE